MITSAPNSKASSTKMKKEKDDGSCGSIMAYVADDSVIRPACFSRYCGATRYVAWKRFGSGWNHPDESNRKRPACCYRAAGRGGWRDLRTGPSHPGKDAVSSGCATAGMTRCQSTRD